MKKIVRIFAFMFAFMLVFVSCGKKAINDPTKVCVELVKADYYVDAYFNEDSFDDYLQAFLHPLLYHKNKTTPLDSSPNIFHFHYQ